MAVAGDILLGYGTADSSLDGIEKKLSAYIGLSDGRIFWSSFLGLIGTVLVGLCFCGIYRLMAQKSPKHAHMYRTGIIGFLIFGPYGIHVSSLMALFFYKSMMEVSPETAMAAAVKFGLYFMVPGFVLFFVFFLILCISQISAFWKRVIPYPRWCWVFCIPLPMAAMVMLSLLPESALINGISAAYISIGYLWTFAGLLAAMPLAQKGWKAAR